MTDDEEPIDPLAEAIRRGEPDALEAAFEHHRDRMRRMIDIRLDARLRGRVSTSDILQETYIEALKRLPHFQNDPDVPFFIWLRSVTIQRVIDVHRHHLGTRGRDAIRPDSRQGSPVVGIFSVDHDPGLAEPRSSRPE